MVMISNVNWCLCVVACSLDTLFDFLVAQNIQPLKFQKQHVEPTVFSRIHHSVLDNGHGHNLQLLCTAIVHANIALDSIPFSASSPLGGDKHHTFLIR